MVGLKRQRRGWADRVRGWDAIVRLFDEPQILQWERYRQPSIEQLLRMRMEGVHGDQLLTITKECDWR